ncbi:hypothetical protein BGZ76_009417 [Entomortierella beljakovae]|nr:hypothetical protein BGZ76_009417 [Entomortierella beljakovae]
MAAAAASRSHFRRILKELHLQYTHPNELTGKGLLGINIHANKLWTEPLKETFRQHSNETDPKKLQKLQTDGEDLAVYLESQRRHKELVESYNPMFWDEEKGIQVDKTAKMVGFEMPENFDESNRDKEYISPPKFTFKKDIADAAEGTASSEKYVELDAPEPPKKRTFKIPKAFGFAEEAEDDIGRAGDRKIE